jgi:hypothetical protein
MFEMSPQISSRATVSISLPASSNSASRALNSCVAGQDVQGCEVGGAVGLQAFAQADQDRLALVQDVVREVVVLIQHGQELVVGHGGVGDGHRWLLRLGVVGVRGVCGL